MATVYDRICYPQNKQTAIYISEQYDGELRDLLSNMITVSDNDAANRLVELLGNGDFNVGKEVVNAFCSANGYSNTHLGRRFMYTNPADDNYTSSSDCRKILSDIYNGVCVNSEASEKMLQFLSAQTRKGKIPSGIHLEFKVPIKQERCRKDMDLAVSKMILPLFLVNSRIT